MSYRKHLMTSDEPPSELYKAVELGTNLAEVGTDCISRQALLDKFEPWLKVKDYNDGELNMLKAVLYEIRFMPPAQPEQLEQCPIYGGMCAYPSGQCYDCPRHAGAKIEVTT